MVKIKRFNENLQNLFEYDIRNIAPKYITVVKGDTTDIHGMLIDTLTGKSTDTPCRYKLGNIMSDPVFQITYDRDFDANGVPDTLEIDIGPIHNDGDKEFHLNVEITFGDLIASGFDIKPPNTVRPYQYTSYHSKMDPSNTVFALTDESLQVLCQFFCHFDGVRVTPEDFKFLDARDNFTDL